MLINDAILQRGRYRIIRHIARIGDDYLYVGQDNVLFHEVIIRETRVNVKDVNTLADHEALNAQFAETAKALSEIDHPEIVCVHNHFFEGNEHYLVTEPVEGTTALESETPLDQKPFGVIERGADAMLGALGYLRESASRFGSPAIRPEFLWLTPDNSFKLLFFGSGIESRDRTELSYLPLEAVWSGLDRASQNVISHSYDDNSLEILEEPADIRSDVYSLGATFYQMATRRKPVDALERSIEILDGKPDPLSPPKSLNPSISESFDAFLLKALELRRENRFESAQTAQTFLQLESAVDELPIETIVYSKEESILLEIPALDGIEPAGIGVYGLKAEIRPNHFAVSQNGHAREELEIGHTRSVFAEQNVLLGAESHESSGNDFFDDGIFDAEPELARNEPGELFLSSKTPSFFTRFFRPIPIAAVALLAVGVSAWGFLSNADSNSLLSNDSMQMSADVTVSDLSKPKAAELPPVPPVAEPAIVQGPETVNSNEVSPSDSNLSNDHNHPQIAASKPVRRPENQVNEKPQPKPKKRVTVDDLINDN